MSNLPIPCPAQPISSYRGNVLLTPIVWLLDLKQKRYMQVRVANTHSYLLRVLRFYQLRTNEPMGTRVKNFLLQVSMSGHELHWAQDNTGTLGALEAAGWTEVPRLHSGYGSHPTRVVIRGKLLQVVHSKSGFVFFSADEPADLRSLMHERIGSAMLCVRRANEWIDPDAAVQALKKLDKEARDSMVTKQRAFRTSFVEFPNIWTHNRALQVFSRREAEQWLLRRGHRQRPFRQPTAEIAT